MRHTILGLTLWLLSSLTVAAVSYDKAVCEGQSFNYCLDQVCMNSSDINCSQNCKQWAKRHCINPNAPDPQQCFYMKKNTCISSVCLNSEEIDCQQKCEQMASRACSK